MSFETAFLILRRSDCRFIKWATVLELLHNSLPDSSMSLGRDGGACWLHKEDDIELGAGAIVARGLTTISTRLVVKFASQ